MNKTITLTSDVPYGYIEGTVGEEYVTVSLSRVGSQLDMELTRDQVKEFARELNSLVKQLVKEEKDE